MLMPTLMRRDLRAFFPVNRALLRQIFEIVATGQTHRHSTGTECVVENRRGNGGTMFMHEARTKEV